MDNVKFEEDLTFDEDVKEDLTFDEDDFLEDVAFDEDVKEDLTFDEDVKQDNILDSITDCDVHFTPNRDDEVESQSDFFHNMGYILSCSSVDRVRNVPESLDARYYGRHLGDLDGKHMLNNIYGIESVECSNAVEDLEQDVRGLKHRVIFKDTLIDELTDVLDKVKNSNSDLQDVVGSLLTENTNLKEDNARLEEQLKKYEAIVEDSSTKEKIMNKEMMMLMAMGGMNAQGNTDGNNNLMAGINPMMMMMMLEDKKGKEGEFTEDKNLFKGMSEKFMPKEIQGGMSFNGELVIGDTGISINCDEEGEVEVKLIDTMGLSMDMPLFSVPTPRASVSKGQVVMLPTKKGADRVIVVTEIKDGKLKGVDVASGNNRKLTLIDNVLGMDMLNVVLNPMQGMMTQGNTDGNNNLMAGINPMMMMMMLED